MLVADDEVGIIRLQTHIRTLRDAEARNQHADGGANRFRCDALLRIARCQNEPRGFAEKYLVRDGSGRVDR